MKSINTDYAPKVVGPYSQAITSNGFVFCAGQIGIDPKTNEFAGNTVEEQTKQVLSNLKAVLEKAGSSLEKATQTTCYLASMDDYQKFNETYATFFTESKPARATVQVAKLPRAALVEISLIATIDNQA